MKLTRRQETFISNLLDLYREAKGPIHYTELAERLGVNRFTAYDMLRLLEEKGLVVSEYQLSKGKSGPGRSIVVFTPTERAHQIMTILAGDIGGLDWEETKQQVLSKIRNGEFEDQDLSIEMFARVPPDSLGVDDAISYCFEVMTIVALRLSKSARKQLVKEYLPEILPIADRSDCAGLSLLGGFTLGILVSEEGNSDWNHELFQHVKRFQELVVNMDDQRTLILAEGITQVFEPIIRDAE